MPVNEQQRWHRVEVPATSANLGPGYDCMGVALAIRDTYRARLSDEPGIRVMVEGEGEGEVPTDETNLVATSVLRCFERMGSDRPVGIDIHCTNRIPHGRGLGSSSAAVVGGLALGRALSPLADELADYMLLEFATELEGHPDNVAPAVYGGFTLSWLERRKGRAVALQPHPDVTPILAVAPTPLSTNQARGIMPEDVPLSEAIFNTSRSAMLCHALTSEPDLLLPATADKLHQRRRSEMYPDSYALVEKLRGHGRAAVISGAGPSVLVLAVGDITDVVSELRDSTEDTWRVLTTSFDTRGVKAHISTTRDLPA